MINHLIAPFVVTTHILSIYWSIANFPTIFFHKFIHINNPYFSMVQNSFPHYPQILV